MELLQLLEEYSCVLDAREDMWSEISEQRDGQVLESAGNTLDEPTETAFFPHSGAITSDACAKYSNADTSSTESESMYVDGTFTEGALALVEKCSVASAGEVSEAGMSHMRYNILRTAAWLYPRSFASLLYELCDRFCWTPRDVYTDDAERLAKPLTSFTHQEARLLKTCLYERGSLRDLFPELRTSIDLELYEAVYMRLHLLASDDAACHGDEEGFDEDSYALSRHCVAPPFVHAPSCCDPSCDYTFDTFLSRRHHCRHCGGSFCVDHANDFIRILKFGNTSTRLRVCAPCKFTIQREMSLERKVWQRLRVAQYLANEDTLTRYTFIDSDRLAHKLGRMASFSAAFLRRSILSWPITICATLLDFGYRYGAAGVAGLTMSNEFSKAASDLKRLSGIDKHYPLSLPELTACIYYSVALERGARVGDPNIECKEHIGKGIRPVLESELSLALRYAPFALEFAYEQDVLTTQRRGDQLGWSLIFSKPNATTSIPEEPHFVLYARGGDDPEAILAIRGTASIEDVVTDLRAMPESFPGTDEDILDMFRGQRRGQAEHEWTAWMDLRLSGETYASSGIARAAKSIVAQIGSTLLLLISCGHRLTIIGHSLGGAVAALVVYLTRRFLTLTMPLGEQRPDLVRGVTYGCPAFVDDRTADELQGSLLSVIIRDDIVCRVTPASIRALMKEMLSFRPHIGAYIDQDYQDLMTRLQSVWRPLVRELSRERANLPLPSPRPQLGGNSLHNYDHDGDNDDSYMDYIVIEEDSLPEMFVPGSVVHLYKDRGQWQATRVPRTLPSLRRIQLQPGMFRDHFATNIFAALHEASVSRKSTNSPMSSGAHQVAVCARGQPPEWMPVSASDSTYTCTCCDAPFNWHSTFQGPAQTLLLVSHCHSCGQPVCKPCSTRHLSLPHLGFTGTRRVCDRCYFWRSSNDVSEEARPSLSKSHLPQREK